MSARALASLVAVNLLVGGLAGCGDDGEDLLGESELQDCLAEEGLTIEPPEAVNPVLGSASPDFTAITTEGVPVYAMVEKNEQRANRTAADIRASLLTVGSGDRVVIAKRNAVVAFDGEPTSGSRQSVDGCLGN
jgi:hypothetical protein